MKFFFALFSILIFFACNQKKVEKIPFSILNDVLVCQNQNGLLKKYGKDQLLLDTSWVMGGDTISGSILFPHSAQQVFLYFHDGNIADVTIMGKSSTWRTLSGLYLGMTLQDVQKINDKNFTISGFNWAHGGSVVSWEGGKLASNHQLSHLVSFSNSDNHHVGLSEKAYAQISGEAEFDVRHPLIQKLNPTLDLISLLVPFTPSQKEGAQMGKQILKSQHPPVEIN